jgi:hypothetical protein
MTWVVMKARYLSIIALTVKTTHFQDEIFD